MTSAHRLSALPPIRPSRTITVPDCGDATVSEFSADGSRLVLAWDDRPVEIWDLARGELALRFDAGNEVECLAFSPDGKAIFAANGNGDAIEIGLWDAQTGAPRWRVETALTEASYPRFTWDGGLIVVADDTSLAVLDARSGAELRQIETGWNGVYDIDISPDGEWVVGTAYEAVHLWRIADGSKIWSVLAEQTHSVAFSPSGDRIAVGTSRGEILVIDATGGAVIGRWNGNLRSVAECMFDGPGTVITGGGMVEEHELISRWDAATGKLLQTFDGTHGSLNTFALGPDGNSFWATGNRDDVCEWVLPR